VKGVDHIELLDLNKIYTYADYYSWRFQERVELIKGRVFKMSPAPNRGHQKISTSLSAMVWNFFQEHPCEVYEAPFDVRLPIENKKGNKAETVVQPDLCVICDLSKLDDRGCEGAPDLVVEILSPGNSQKEMKQKYEVYEEAGVKEYWLINPLDKVTFIYTLNDDGTFVGQKPVIVTEPLTSYIFPDLQIDQSILFR